MELFEHHDRSSHLGRKFTVIDSQSNVMVVEDDETGMMMVWETPGKTNELIKQKLEAIMATLAELDAAIAQLNTDFDALVARIGTPPAPVDVAAQVAAVQALDARVVATDVPAPPVA